MSRSNRSNDYARCIFCRFPLEYIVMVSEALAYQVKNIITSATRVCLPMSRNPDPDAVGSAAALAHWCLSLGKPCVLYVAGDSVLARHIAPLGVDCIFDAALLPRDINVVVTVDSGDLGYSGAAEVCAVLPVSPTVINIDHHKSNTRYGQCNIIAEKAASTTQVIFDLFKKCGMATSREMAECLFLGLLCDTHGFTNPSTTPEALEMAGELVGLGADPAHLQKQWFRTGSLQSLRALGRVLAGSGMSRPWQVAYAIAHEPNRPREGNGISNLFNALGEGKAAMILKEREGGVIHCSMRTTRDDVDLAELAQFFGGGGHAKAAGFTIKGEIVSIGRSMEII